MASRFSDEGKEHGIRSQCIARSRERGEMSSGRKTGSLGSTQTVNGRTRDCESTPTFAEFEKYLKIYVYC